MEYPLILRNAYIIYMNKNDKGRVNDITLDDKEFINSISVFSKHYFTLGRGVSKNITLNKEGVIKKGF